MNAVLSIFKHVVNIIFPETCAGCGEGGTILCAACLDSAPLAREPEHRFINAVFDYRNPAIRKVIWQFKYKNARSVATCFGEKLYEGIIGELGDELHISKRETFLLVPIPLHSKRTRERGYNQSELLARAIVKYDTENIFQIAPGALFRTKETNPQAKKEKRAARFENLHGAFIPSTETVRGKHIILIDDVTTTGATLSEARKALLKAGARTVKAWTVAH